jgi:hypothetical protein
MTANESDQSVSDEVEISLYGGPAPRRSHIRSRFPVNRRSRRDGRQTAEEFFGLTDHLMLGVLDAIGRRPAPAFDYRLAAE